MDDAVLHTDSQPKSAYWQQVDGRSAELRWFGDEGVLPNDLIAGKTILDWECGNCAYSAALIRHGAAEVVAIDTWFHESWIPSEDRAHIPVLGTKIDIANYVARGHEFKQFDLVFCNTVTEHIQDLPSAFDNIFKILKPGGYFFTNHGNYYDPVGHHDHGFLFYRNGGVEYLGPKCWEITEKCEASATFRKNMRANQPWLLDEDFENRLTPDNCGSCSLYKRSQPWAHLIYQSEFRDVFRNPGFTTGRSGSSLNKFTSFQVRQLLIESGFDVVKEHRSMVNNEPPPELLAEPFNFSAIELKTAAHRYLARKPG